MIYTDSLIEHNVEKIYDKVLIELKRLIPLKKDQENKLEKFKEILTQVKQDLLSLPDNWDDDGAIKFSDDTLCRMEQFCLELYKRVLKEEIDIDPPFICPMNDGSLDVLWQEKEEDRSYTLLINISNSLFDPISVAITRIDAE